MSILMALGVLAGHIVFTIKRILLCVLNDLNNLFLDLANKVFIQIGTDTINLDTSNDTINLDPSNDYGSKDID